MKYRKVIVHTDLLMGHLTAAHPPSLLRRAMGEWFCYTTVFHAITLFAWAESRRAQKAVEDMFAPIRILGLNAQSAPLFGSLLAQAGKKNVMDVLVAGVCLQSRLPLLTDRTSDFTEFRGLKILPATRSLRRKSSVMTLRGE
jgi:predicted nucleic acid-binding protein